MDQAAFLEKIGNLYERLKERLLYFLDKPEPYDYGFALKMKAWFTEVATKNQLLHSGVTKEKVQRPRKFVYWIDFGVNIGSEFNGPHFAVVIKEFSHTAIVVPLSSVKEDDGEWKNPDNLIIPIGCIDGLPKDKKPCYAMVNQIRSVSKQRLSSYQDRTTKQYYKLKLRDDQMDLIDKAILSLTKVK
ncbi:type II toxin-antitoxin system PemK/MazF family toxin [Brevibacillus gelatini]|uniref:type II toxin-antitoxin system PemK/MazF family toxin n=1 Tax=Brevibacillus gelatini TaxID=1655277 RepID=UPI003D81750F